MQFLNKTILLPTFDDIHNLLKHDTVKTNYSNNKIAIKHYVNNNLNLVKIWNITSISNYMHQNSNIDNFIMAIDYIINKDNIRIEFLNINDKQHSNVHRTINFLSEHNAFELTKSMIIFIENIAKKNNINKIIFDVHCNLNMYNKYYKGFFQLTNCNNLDNLFQLEAERNISLFF